MKPTGRLALGLVIGCAAGVALGQAGLYLLREVWPAYVVADLEKSYSTAMLLLRLTVGAVSAVAAGCVTTWVAADDGRGAWWLGGMYLLFSLPIHVFFVWNDFPVWYHVAYLAYLVPLTGLAGGALYANWIAGGQRE